MPPKPSFGQNLFSSLKQRLQEWIRREIVDDDPWDETSSLLGSDRSNLDESTTKIETDIETKTKTDID